MLHFGVRHFVDLTEEGELKPYSHLLPKDATYMRFPIRDCGARYCKMEPAGIGGK